MLFILGLIFGKDFLGGNAEAPNNAPANNAGQDDKILVFTAKILGTTEAVWQDEFRKMGKTYMPPHLELFSDQVRTGCGIAPSAVGSFYCPTDMVVYLDPTFFDELERKLGGSKAEFSEAKTRPLFRNTVLEGFVILRVERGNFAIEQGGFPCRGLRGK